MSGFAYFVPGRRDEIWRHEDVVKVGLGYAIPAQVDAAGVSGQGPSGGHGVMLAARGGYGKSRLGFYPDRQRWRRLPGSENWVGLLNKAEPPGPQELQRERVLPGHPVRLGDEQVWMIPVARAAVEEEGELRGAPGLPAALDVDEDGNWVAGAVVPEYADLYAVAERWWEVFCAGQDPEPGEQQEPGLLLQTSLAEMYDWAVLAVAGNYRLGKVEIGMLGLFNSAVCRDVLLALIDWPVIKAWLQKKAEADGSSTAAG